MHYNQGRGACVCKKVNLCSLDAQVSYSRFVKVWFVSDLDAEEGITEDRLAVVDNIHVNMDGVVERYAKEPFHVDEGGNISKHEQKLVREDQRRRGRLQLPVSGPSSLSLQFVSPGY